ESRLLLNLLKKSDGHLESNADILCCDNIEAESPAHTVLRDYIILKWREIEGKVRNRADALKSWERLHELTN
ncbi:MAG TPA: hypothetical protein VFQ43_02770, partial [Nitrososphaera sp.]|nr:hypothetical protein [Nitrososphaera sp.]